MADAQRGLCHEHQQSPAPQERTVPLETLTLQKRYRVITHCISAGGEETTWRDHQTSGTPAEAEARLVQIATQDAIMPGASDAANKRELFYTIAEEWRPRLSGPACGWGG